MKPRRVVKAMHDVVDVVTRVRANGCSIRRCIQRFFDAIETQFFRVAIDRA